MRNLFSRRNFGFLILAMWLASLVLPVFTACGPGYDNTPGYMILLIGWMGLLIIQPAWFANLLIVAVIIVLLLRNRVPLWLGIATPLVAAPALFFTDMYDDRGAIPICHYQTGYWLWLATAGMALLATLLTRGDEPASE